MTHPLTAYPRDRRASQPLGASPRVRRGAWLLAAVNLAVATLLLWLAVRS